MPSDAIELGVVAQRALLHADDCRSIASSLGRNARKRTTMNRLVSSLLLCSLVLTAAPLAVHADDELPPADPQCQGCQASGGGETTFPGGADNPDARVWVKMDFKSGTCKYSADDGECKSTDCKLTMSVTWKNLTQVSQVTIGGAIVHVGPGHQPWSVGTTVPCGETQSWLVHWSGRDVTSPYTLTCTGCDFN